MAKNEYMSKKESSIMTMADFFSKMENFDNIVTDKTSLTVFLTIAKKKIAYLDDLEEETKLDLKDIVNSLDKLERGDFVKKNPNSSSRKYVLGFSGQLFAEQLRDSYPEIRILLGNERIIEPLKS